jgi:hypothetical protein
MDVESLNTSPRQLTLNIVQFLTQHRSVLRTREERRVRDDLTPAWTDRRALQLEHRFGKNASAQGHGDHHRRLESKRAVREARQPHRPTCCAPKSGQNSAGSEQLGRPCMHVEQRGGSAAGTSGASSSYPVESDAGVGGVERAPLRKYKIQNTKYTCVCLSILSPGQGLRTRAKRTTGKQGRSV